MKRALIAGATGLVGSRLLALLLDSPRYSTVTAITRRPLDVQHPKLVNVVAEIDDLPSHEAALVSDDIFCCVGTTIRKAQTRQAFRKVDLEYPLQLARLGFRQGASQFLIITALGASTRSGFYYNRIKGEVEDALRKVGFRSLHLFRPSLLLGPRTEERAGEDAAKLFFRLFGFLVPKSYKGIEAAKVARAMLAEAEKDRAGQFIHESASMQDYG